MWWSVYEGYNRIFLRLGSLVPKTFVAVDEVEHVMWTLPVLFFDMPSVQDARSLLRDKDVDFEPVRNICNNIWSFTVAVLQMYLPAFSITKFRHCSVNIHRCEWSVRHSLRKLYKSNTQPIQVQCLYKLGVWCVSMCLEKCASFNFYRRKQEIVSVLLIECL